MGLSRMLGPESVAAERVCSPQPCCIPWCGVSPLPWELPVLRAGGRGALGCSSPWGAPVPRVLRSLRCSGTQDAQVPEVLRSPGCTGPQGSSVSGVHRSPGCLDPQSAPVPGVLQSLLEEAAETEGGCSTSPVLGFITRVPEHSVFHPSEHLSARSIAY